MEFAISFRTEEPPRLSEDGFPSRSFRLHRSWKSRKRNYAPRLQIRCTILTSRQRNRIRESTSRKNVRPARAPRSGLDDAKRAADGRTKSVHRKPPTASLKPYHKGLSLSFPFLERLDHLIQFHLAGLHLGDESLERLEVVFKLHGPYYTKNRPICSPLPGLGPICKRTSVRIRRVHLPRRD